MRRFSHCVGVRGRGPRSEPLAVVPFHDVKQPRKLSLLMVRSAARRVSNHEGTQVDPGPPILRDGPSGLLWMRRCWQSRDATQCSLLRSRAAFVRRGSSPFLRIHPPKEGVAERRQAHSSLLCRACEARRPRERNAGRPVATGTPSRRSVVAIFGRGPVLPPPAVAPEPMSTCPRQTLRSDGRGPGPPALRFAPQSRDATPRSIVRIVSGGRPLTSEDENLYSITSLRSQ
jgi:hypothetical protein